MPSDIHIYPAATTYVFAIPSPETGISCDSIEQNDNVDVYEKKNEQGEIVEVVTFNPTGEITVSGESTAALTAILGKVFTFINLITTQFPNAITGASTIVRSVQYTQARRSNPRVSSNSKCLPLVADPLMIVTFIHVIKPNHEC